MNSIIKASLRLTDCEGWRIGDRFLYDGVRYTFTGKDQVGGLHASRDDAPKQDVFESSGAWEGVG